MSSSKKKTCSKCQSKKPQADFGKNSRSRDGLQSWCRVCFRDYNKQWYPANKKRVLEAKKVQYAQRKFGQ